MPPSPEKENLKKITMILIQIDTAFPVAFPFPIGDPGGVFDPEANFAYRCCCWAWVSWSPTDP